METNWAMLQRGEGLDQPILHGESSGSSSEGIGVNRRGSTNYTVTRKSTIWSHFSLKNRNINFYQRYNLIVLQLLNIIIIIVNTAASIWFIDYECTADYRALETTLCIIEAAFASVIACLVLRVYFYPSPNIALLIFCFIAVNQVLFLIQGVTVFQHYGYTSAGVVYDIIVQVLLLFSLIMQYYFWEVLTFNYDPTNSERLSDSLSLSAKSDEFNTPRSGRSSESNSNSKLHEHSISSINSTSLVVGWNHSPEDGE